MAVAPIAGIGPHTWEGRSGAVARLEAPVAMVCLQTSGSWWVKKGSREAAERGQYQRQAQSTLAVLWSTYNKHITGAQGRKWVNVGSGHLPIYDTNTWVRYGKQSQVKLDSCSHFVPAVNVAFDSNALIIIFQPSSKSSTPARNPPIIIISSDVALFKLRRGGWQV